ncbi:MAG: hypothetical protein IT377_22540 [Polyangiaceae bacterium]|nr:hypothetical protein [Polyangiaceae bacterium]
MSQAPQHTSDAPRGGPLDPDGLLCALVLVPPTFSRNRFFAMFQDPVAGKVRRRAARVRGIIRQLLGQGRQKAELTGEAVLDDGQVLLRFRVEGLSYDRTAALTQIEAAALRYALHRAGAGGLDDADKALVEQALSRLGGVAVTSAQS